LQCLFLPILSRSDSVFVLTSDTRSFFAAVKM
jgi:hypothetical protein